MSIETPRILIADDEQHMRILIKMIVEKLGYEVIAETVNGDETIKKFKEVKPDIVMLDINMPLKTGINVLEEISDDIEDSCVIMMTSLSDLETVESCIELGAYGFIRKDTPVNQMMKIIKETWEEYNTEKEEFSNAISEV